jgi:hypothetical protein
MSVENSNSADLFWQAFRYAGDEMTPAERQEFDTLLSANQEAREAVACVIELESLVLSAECTMAKQFAVGQLSDGQVSANGQLDDACQTHADKLQLAAASEPSYWMQPVGWISLGAAACLAAVMAFQSLGPASRPLGVGPTAGQPAVGHMAAGNMAVDADGADSVAGELALAWAQTLTELPVVDISATDIADRDAELQDRVDRDLVQANEDQPAAAPTWLLVAVADAEAGNLEN